MPISPVQFYKNMYRGIPFLAKNLFLATHHITLILVFCLLFITINGYAQVGIGTTTPKANLHVENGSILATSLGMDATNHPDYNANIPTPPVNYFMQWSNQKCAFRSIGIRDVNGADDAYLGPVFSGNYSFASGFEVLANGTASTAFGQGVAANGAGSFGIGYKAQANGKASFSQGYFSEANGDYSIAIGSFAKTNSAHAVVIGSDVLVNNGSGAFAFGDYSLKGKDVNTNGVSNSMYMRFTGGYSFLTGNVSGVHLAPGGASWSVLSDKRKKENFLPVNGEDVLRKIAEMELTTWNYKGQDPKLFRHYGPMAQDFFKAFGKDEMGTIGNDTTINQADFDGINLIAIQALIQRTNDLERMCRSISRQIYETESNIQKLQAVNKKRKSRNELSYKP
jgi:hypothetical protein